MLRFITRSIRHKLAVVVLAVTLAALVVAGTALVTYDLRLYHSDTLSDFAAQAEILGRASAPALTFDDPKVAREYLALLRAKPEISAAAIYNAKGKQFATYTRREPGSPLPMLPEQDGARADGRDIVVFSRIVENNEILGTVYLRGDDETRERLVHYLGIFGSVMMLSLLVALLVWGWAQSRLTRPIRDMTAATQRVVKNRDFSVRIEKSTEDEIGSLADNFNDMLAELGRREEALEASRQSLAREAADRERAQEELTRLNAELEGRVAERTGQLEAANKELEGFSYSVSHDLRAPLRAVAGYSQMLLEDHADQLDAEAQRKLNVVQDEARRMGTLIDELLAFSRLGRKAMQMGEIDMTGLARTTYDGLNGQNHGATAEFRLAHLPRGRGDRVLLGQVWANLLSNAMKFSSKREHPVIEVSAITDEKEHVYFVRDNGAGFDPRFQSKLFGVFQRLHKSDDFPGTGVGLALVQRIVVRHGGRVWADGRPGEGATFYFTLPKEHTDERF